VDNFRDDVLQAIDRVTNWEGKFCEDFVKRPAGNPSARRVKIADMQGNPSPQL
jgi:hypothetical protein